MKTPLLPPAALMSFLALAQPALAEDAIGTADGVCGGGRYGEAFKSYAALAQEDDAGAPFKLATLYYTANDDVRAALWCLITGTNSPDCGRKAAA